MVKTENGRTGKTRKTSGGYFAVKTHNDIFYQMASIYQQAEADQSGLAKQIFLSSMMGQISNISLEKSF